MPVVAVASTARWTLRALNGGYSHVYRRGRLEAFAEEGPYRLLMEGIEAWCGLAATSLAEPEQEDDYQQNYATDRFGNRYKSAMPARR
jgi:hypothetical protein